MIIFVAMYTQLLINTLSSGLLLALVATGFLIVFRTTKVFHLAHGAIYVSAAYGTYALYESTPPFWGKAIICSLASIALVVVIALLIEKLVYLPLEQKKSGQAITLISSVGIYLFIINTIALLFGNESKYIALELGQSYQWGEVIVVPIQMWQISLGSILLLLLMLLSKTNYYLHFRATMSDRLVASVMGIDSNRVRRMAMTLGSILASAAAILSFFDTGMDPHSGMSITLSAAVAAILSGGSLGGTILAALLIASLQTATEWLVSAQWKSGITFLLLIIVIMWRTEGIVSFKMRVEEH